MKEKIIIESKQYQIKKIIIALGIIILVIGLTIFGIISKQNYNEDIEYYCTEETYGTDYIGALDSCEQTYMSYAFNNFFALKYGNMFGVSYTIIGVLIILLIFYLYMRKMKIVVTKDRVYGTSAFGKRVDLPIDKISSIETSILNGIKVGTSSGFVKFKMIKNSTEIHTKIAELINDRQKQDHNTKKDEQEDEIEKLKKYKELLDDGAITQEEYDKKKKELLNL